jgi:cytochrome o ubiquinol oxidase subunit 2
MAGNSRASRPHRCFAARAAAAVAIAGCGIALSGCGPAILQPKGPVAGAETTILLNALAIMGAVVLPTIAATLGFAWWYRASNRKARYLPDFDYSGRIEMITWAIPALVVMFLGGMTWIGSHQLDPYRKLPSSNPPVEVQVVSLDWKWLFIYPAEGIAAVNELTIPAGVPVHFSLTSASVMNTFFIPQLGGMIYTMHAMSDQLSLQADHPGTYYGQSGHFSGDGFSGMHFDVHALAPGDYAAWVQSIQGKGPTLDRSAYTALARQSSNVPPVTYGTVAPGLYDMIVKQDLPPGPGPAAGRPAADVSPRSGAGDAR